MIAYTGFRDQFDISNTSLSYTFTTYGIGRRVSKPELTKKEKDLLKSKRLLKTGYNNPSKIKIKRHYKIKRVSRNIRNTLPIKIRRNDSSIYKNTKGI